MKKALKIMGIIGGVAFLVCKSNTYGFIAGYGAGSESERPTDITWDTTINDFIKNGDIVTLVARSGRLAVKQG